LRAQGVGYS